MITVSDVVGQWFESYVYVRVYLIGGGNKSGSKIRFLGVGPDERDPVKSQSICYGCPDVTDRDARAFVGIDPRFDAVLATMLLENAESRRNREEQADEQ